MLNELRQLSQYFLQIKQQNYQRYFFGLHQKLPRMSILLGPRGIGKTTLLIQYLLHYAQGDIFDPKILYLQADHFLVGDTSIYEIAEQFHAMGGQFIAIDEIHKYPNWSQELKSIFDTFLQLQIIASGSSALEIYRGSHDLSRRAITFRINGLSFREYLELSMDIPLPCCSLEEIFTDHSRLTMNLIKILEKENQKILPWFDKYLHQGYYPYSVELNSEMLFYMTLEQNLHATIEMDLVAVHPELSGNSIYKIKKLLAYIAQAVPFTPNWQQLKNILEIGDSRTLKNYFKYLQEAGLIRTLSKTTTKISQVDHPEKIYLDNPNQMYAISPLKTNKGTIREIFFLNMLSQNHTISLPLQADFLINDQYTIEVGGRNKTTQQIKSIKNAYLAIDDIEMGIHNKIPLWLFGFIY